MNALPSQSSVSLSRPLGERVLSELRRALRAAGILRALWRDSRARSREARAVAAIADMNEHMLRDIGADDRLIAHAVARSDPDHRRRIAVQLGTPLLVVALIATVAVGATAEAANLRPTGKERAQMVGVFTGEYVNGAPVYRLPPVTIAASRRVERAKPEREEASTRAQQARAKHAARNPA